jgi:hypothetical protein
LARLGSGDRVVVDVAQVAPTKRPRSAREPAQVDAPAAPALPRLAHLFRTAIGQIVCERKSV